MTPITLHVSDEEAHRLSQRARESGYNSIEAYLRALVDADSNKYPDEQPDAIHESIRRGFEDAFSGRTMSEAEFWHRLNTDAD